MSENTNKEMIEVKIIARKFKRKTDGGEFTAYRAVQRDGKLIEAHFRKECGALPQKSFILTAPRSDVKMDNTHEFPRVWFHSITNIVTLDEARAADTETADDLPF